MINGLSSLSTCIEKLVNSITPRPGGTCIVCLAQTAPGGLCNSCRTELPWNRQHCRCCALPLAFALPAPTSNGLLCGECLTSPPPFDRIVTPWRYRFPVDRMIQRYKYHGQRAFAGPLIQEFSQHITDYLASQPEHVPGVLVPSPMHRSRRRKRGFNQAEDLAEQLSRHTRIPLDTRLLKRVRQTRSQSGLGRDQRLSNLRGIFQVTGVPPERVAIIDDVVTTGATARALSDALLAAGAGQVEIWALARTPG